MFPVNLPRFSSRAPSDAASPRSLKRTVCSDTCLLGTFSLIDRATGDATIGEGGDVPRMGGINDTGGRVSSQPCSALGSERSIVGDGAVKWAHLLASVAGRPSGGRMDAGIRSYGE